MRWVDITSNGSSVACCRHPISKDHWHAGLFEDTLICRETSLRLRSGLALEGRGVLSHAPLPCAVPADICESALSPSTKYMTTMLAWVIPLATLMLNTLFSYSLPREVQESQRRRLGLYLTIMAFRSFVLLWTLNKIEDFVQGKDAHATIVIALPQSSLYTECLVVVWCGRP